MVLFHSTFGGLIMGKHVSKDDQLRLIQECRNSGLSDYQWCTKNGIPHSSFYRWVTQLRTEACASVPSKVVPVSEKQEVVKLEISEELPVVNTFVDEPKAESSANTMEIKLNGITINVNNNVDRNLLIDVINSIGGLLF